MKPTIYLHIGAPKTGTSNLQGSLACADETLRKHGFLYPRSCRQGVAHHVLVCDLIDKYQARRMPDVWFGDYPRGKSWGALEQEIAGYDGRLEGVILSSELFFGQSHNLDRMLGDINRSLAGYPVKVVIYLRRQDQMYSSFYNQDVKGTRQWGHSAYRFYQTHQLFQRNYYEMVSLWASAFGADNIILRPFEPGADVVGDFCQTLGIPTVPRIEGERNESLGMNQLFIKRCLNLVGFEKSMNERVLDLLFSLCPESPGSGTLYVNRGFYGRLREDWKIANRKLSAKYLDGAPLFASDFPRPIDLEPFAVSKPVLVEFLHKMIRTFSRGQHDDVRQLFSKAAMYMIAAEGMWNLLEEKQLQVLVRWCAGEA